MAVALWFALEQQQGCVSSLAKHDAFAYRSTGFVLMMFTQWQDGAETTKLSKAHQGPVLILCLAGHPSAIHF